MVQVIRSAVAAADAAGAGDTLLRDVQQRHGAILTPPEQRP